MFLWILNLHCKLLNRFSNSLLQSFLKKEEEKYEHKDVENQQSNLEQEKVPADKSFQLVFDTHCHFCLLPTDYGHIVLCSIFYVIRMESYIVQWTPDLIGFIFISIYLNCVIKSTWIVGIFILELSLSFFQDLFLNLRP